LLLLPGARIKSADAETEIRQGGGLTEECWGIFGNKNNNMELNEWIWNEWK